MTLKTRSMGRQVNLTLLSEMLGSQVLWRNVLDLMSLWFVDSMVPIFSTYNVQQARWPRTTKTPILTSLAAHHSTNRLERYTAFRCIDVASNSSAACAASWGKDRSTFCFDTATVMGYSSWEGRASNWMRLTTYLPSKMGTSSSANMKQSNAQACFLTWIKKNENINDWKWSISSISLVV